MNSPNPDLSVDLLVIGYGNTLRSDDAVGPRVAEAVRELNLPGVRTLSCGLLTPELSDPISQARKVVFVDASMEEPAEIRLRPDFAGRIIANPGTHVRPAHSVGPGTRSLRSNASSLVADDSGAEPGDWGRTVVQG